MAYYFFHLREGTNELLDSEGFHCSSIAETHSHALAGARDILSAEIRTGLLDLRYRIDVEDVSGRTVHTLAFEDAVKFRTD